MLDFSRYTLMAATLMVALAAIVYLLAQVTRPAPAPNLIRERELVRVGAGPSGGATDGRAASGPARRQGLDWVGYALAAVAALLLTASAVSRVMVTGHAPFANQHEFAVSFAWGISLAFLYFQWRYRVRAMALVVLPLTLVVLIYAWAQPNDVEPLLPALQNSLLLTLHVITAVLAYGAAAVSFAAAVLYLIRPYVRWKGLPSAELLDEIGYRAVVFCFPTLTVMIGLGAVWADVAWGRYWSWDPKETAALVTWLIYGAYLHARVVADWRGKRAAWLLVVGFAAVVFTFLGNHFFGGLHSYG
ncbi:c-type cytochrome biogenesis protein CcsB [Nigerium massiliense]|uniref:c-type cytochrome biogenesis protein CcsB n=1 Tax=Nigerium massiliense TaxID=1522317 RepID=UPI00058AC55F|nr:c-type cytochrome biogenesis protein CcsB [Nigerium massiliense]